MMRTFLVETQVLFLYTTVPKGCQNRCNCSVCILQLTIKPQICFLVALLLHHISIKLFQHHLLICTFQLTTPLQSLLKLNLILSQLLSLPWNMVQMLYYCIFSIQQHYEHSHGFNILLREVCVLEFNKIVFVIYFKTTFFTS